MFDSIFRPFDVVKNRASLSEAQSAISAAKHCAGINVDALRCLRTAEGAIYTQGPRVAHEWALESLKYSMGPMSSIYQRVKAQSR